MYIPGVDLSRIVDGKSLSDHWMYYTVNVLKLETMTHEEFCREFPNAAEEIARATEIMDSLDAEMRRLAAGVKSKIL